MQLIAPVKGFTINFPFGAHYSNSENGDIHYGVDYPTPVGTPTYAAADGKVIFSGYDNSLFASRHNGGFGYHTRIDHGNGYVTYYAHASNLLKRVGDRVSQGMLIQYSGRSGNVTGAHTHFEVRLHGVPVNPVPYMTRTEIVASKPVFRLADLYPNAHNDTVMRYQRMLFERQGKAYQDKICRVYDFRKRGFTYVYGGVTQLMTAETYAYWHSKEPSFGWDYVKPGAPSMLVNGRRFSSCPGPKFIERLGGVAV